MDLQALRARRDAVARNLSDLVDDKKTPEWKPEHQAQYDAAMAEIADIDAKINRYQKTMDAIGQQAGENGNVPDELRNQFTRTPGAQANPEESRALRAFLSGGINNLSPESLQSLRARQGVGDIASAMLAPMAQMSTTTPGEGGFTVAQEYYRELTQAMAAYGGLRGYATPINTGTGANMTFPGTDATSEEGEIVGQNTVTTALDTTVMGMSLAVYKYSSKSIAIPFELIQDSMFDLESYIKTLLSMRVGRITAKHYITGTGNGQPTGLITAAKLGKAGATGQTATVTYDDLVDLEHSVDPAYRSSPKVGFLMHDDSLGAIRKIKDGNGRPLFVPGYEQGNPGGAPDRLMNRPIVIDQGMPTMAANAKSIAFGDLSRYFIRQVMDLTIFRMVDSAYTLKGQIGFVAFNRQGGNLIDVGGAVKYYQNSAT